MQPDPLRVLDTGAWFEKANKDLRYADIALAATPAACSRG